MESRLEKKEPAINKQMADRAANGGKLSAAEKQEINKQQNQMSEQICTTETQPGAGQP